MASGVKIDDSVPDIFEQLKTKKLKDVRYVVMKIENKKKIIVEKTVEISVAEEGTDQREFELAAFREDMGIIAAAKECRFVVYDFPTVTATATNNKLLFVSWCPDSSTIMEKMIYNASKGGLKDKIKITHEVQANDMSDLTVEMFQSKLA